MISKINKSVIKEILSLYIPLKRKFKLSNKNKYLTSSFDLILDYKIFFFGKKMKNRRLKI
jgi:hypothetical protein